MKFFFVFILACASVFSEAQSQYPKSFQDIYGQSVNFADSASKKLLIVICNAAAPDALQLAQIDSFYQANTTILSLIILPINDFGASAGDSALSVFFRDNLHLHGVIGQTGTGSKDSGNNQPPLLTWLTHVSDNMHFDNDIAQDGQMYLIDQAGVLVGQFMKATPIRYFRKMIK